MHKRKEKYPKLDVGGQHSTGNSGKAANHDCMQLWLGHQFQEGADQDGGLRLQHNIPVGALLHECWLYLCKMFHFLSLS